MAYYDGKSSAMSNLHLPSPPNRRQRLRAQIAEFASEHAGSALDLDEDVERAAIEALKATDQHVPPMQAPMDDESDDDFDGELTEARADIKAGRVVSHEEVKRRWGLRLR